jgi:hypothetical protein
MGQHQSTYTPEQRQAVADAALKDRWTAQDIIRRAKAGELKEGLGPFQIAESSVYDIALKDASEQVRPGRPSGINIEAFDRIENKIAALLERELDYYLDRNRLGRVDWTAIKYLTSAASRYMDLSQKARNRAKQARPKAPTPTKPTAEKAHSTANKVREAFTSDDGEQAGSSTEPTTKNSSSNGGGAAHLVAHEHDRTPATSSDTSQAAA